MDKRWGKRNTAQWAVLRLWKTLSLRASAHRNQGMIAPGNQKDDRIAGRIPMAASRPGKDIGFFDKIKGSEPDGSEPSYWWTITDSNR